MTESKFKVGDRVFDLRYGWGVVMTTSGWGPYPLKVHFLDSRSDSYLANGLGLAHDAYPILWTADEAKAKGYPPPKVKRKVTRTGWVNVYPSSGQYPDGVHITKEDADYAAAADRIACVPVTYEFEVEEDEGCSI